MTPGPMRSRVLPRPFVSLVLVLQISAVAGAHADALVTPGTDCAPVAARQLNRLKWRDLGLVNASRGAVAVMCPLRRSARSFDSVRGFESWEFWSGAAVVTSLASNSAPRNVICVAREMVGGSRVWSRKLSLSLAPGASAVMTWPAHRVADPELSHLSVQCNLAPKTAVATLVSATTKSADSRLVNSIAASLAGAP